MQENSLVKAIKPAPASWYHQESIDNHNEVFTKGLVVKMVWVHLDIQMGIISYKPNTFTSVPLDLFEEVYTI